MPDEAQLSPLLAQASMTGQPILRPAGEFNHARVFAQGVVEHWLNGVKLLTLYMSPDGWGARVAGGAARDPQLGQLQLARLVASGAGTAVWILDVKVRHRGVVAGSEVVAPGAVEPFDGVDLAG